MPDRTTVASRQSKQVRLLDRLGIPVSFVYSADLPVDEEVEINVGDSADVQVAAEKEKSTIDPKRTKLLPLVPGLTLRSTTVDSVSRVDISNALAAAIQFELRLRLPEGGRVIRADHPVGAKNGRPIFRLTIPANGTVTLRYQTQHTVG